MPGTDPHTLLMQLPKYEGNQRTLVDRQDTFDIVREILNMHKKTTGDYDLIAINHWRGNVPATVAQLYYWAKQTLPYKAEKTKTQTVKSPAAIIKERYDFGNDCKHYASYIVGIGQALKRMGYPVECFYRFGSYNKARRRPGHVFAVFRHNDQELWCDPTPEIGGFDKRYLVPCYHTDKMPPQASYRPRGGGISGLYEITGTNDAIPVPSNRIIAGTLPNRIIAGHWTDGLGGAGDDIGKAKKKKKHKAHKDHKKVKGKFVAKFGLATSRNAYLSLLKLNVFHMATKMWPKVKDKNSADWKNLAAKWAKLGGKPDSLYKNIRQGVNTWNKLHPSNKISGYGMLSGVEDMGYPCTVGAYDDGMTLGDIICFVHENHARHMAHHGRRHGWGVGVVAAPAAAGIIAAAAPIIKALAGLLKSFGVNTNKAADAAEEDEKNLADKHNDSDGGDHADGSETEVKTNADGSTDLIVKKLPGVTPGTGSATNDSPVADGADDDDTTTKTKTVTKTKTKVTKGGDDDGGVSDMFGNVMSYIKEHKAGVALTAAGALGLTYSVGHKFPKNSNAPVIIGLVSATALVFGGVQLFKK